MGPAKVQMGIPESEKQFMKTAIGVARAAGEIRRIRKVISRIPKAIRRAKSIPPRIQYTKLAHSFRNAVEGLTLVARDAGI